MHHFWSSNTSFSILYIKIESCKINFVFYIRILEKIEATLVDNGKDVFANTHIRMGTI